MLFNLVNGNWGSWTAFSACSKSCASGTQSRSRLCNSPAPANGGAACVGSATESATCSTQSCTAVGKISKHFISFTINQINLDYLLKCHEVKRFSFSQVRDITILYVIFTGFNPLLTSFIFGYQIKDTVQPHFLVL